MKAEIAKGKRDMNPEETQRIRTMEPGDIPWFNQALYEALGEEEKNRASFFILCHL